MSPLKVRMTTNSPDVRRNPKIALRSVRTVDALMLVAAATVFALTRFGKSLNCDPEANFSVVFFLLASEAAVIVSIAELLNPDRRWVAQLPFIAMLVLSVFWFFYALVCWGWCGSPKVWSVLFVAILGAAWIAFLNFQYNAKDSS